MDAFQRDFQRETAYLDIDGTLNSHEQILNMDKFIDSTNLDKFHDNWEIVIEGYIRQHLAKYRMHQNIPPEIVEWLWLFAHRLTKEEKRTINIVIAIASHFHQFTNEIADEFETHSYNYKVKKWSDIYLDSYQGLKSKTDAIMVIVDVNSDKDTIQQTYTQWFSIWHNLFDQMVICIASADKNDMNETKYNYIKDAIMEILTQTGYENIQNQIPFIPIDKQNNTFTQSNEKQFVWYEGYDALLIPTLNTKHKVHTLYDVLERTFIPLCYED
eukprot:1072140_1